MTNLSAPASTVICDDHIIAYGVVVHEYGPVYSDIFMSDLGTLTVHQIVMKYSYCSLCRADVTKYHVLLDLTK